MPPLETISLTERTELPRIQVKSKGGQVRYSAYVNGYICGPRCRINGSSVIPLYYLSLIEMAGGGGKLQGIWSALASEPPLDVYLEPEGTVVLARHDPQFARLGYSLHWHYRQGAVADRSNDLHAVIESHMLTMFDPLAGSQPIKRQRSQPLDRHHGQQRKKRASQGVQLTTAVKKDLGELEERKKRELHPLFLLLVPGSMTPLRERDEPEALYQERRAQAVSNFLAEQHFAFLDKRAPWPMRREWAGFLWQRACVLQETVRLTTWFRPVAQYHDDEEEGGGYPQGNGADDVLHPAVPLISEAWLCRPNITQLEHDLRQALRSGRISNLRASSGETPQRQHTMALVY